MGLRLTAATVAMTMWACCLACPLLLPAQTVGGVIEGTVTDPTGAVVANAEISLVHLGTGLIRQTTTTSNGFFRVTSLPLGAYRVTVTHAGFSPWVLDRVAVTLGSNVSVMARLSIVPLAQQVVVPAPTGLVGTETATSSGFEESELRELPTRGRDYQDFLFLTPNVHTSMGLDGLQVHVNGQKNIQTGFLVDGANANNGFFGLQRGALRRSTNIIYEAVGEFRVVAEGATAEFGGYAGAFVVAATKSGDNRFHGSLFHGQELKGLTSRLADGATLRGYHSERFGGSAGGAIRKDKVFFFGAYEQAIKRFAKDNDLIHCCVAFDAQGIARLTPASAGGVPVDLGEFLSTRFGSPESGPIQHSDDLQGFVLRLDWLPTALQPANLRYSFTRAPGENSVYDLPNFGRSANGDFLERYHSLVASWNWAVSARFLNEFRFQYARERLQRDPVSRTLPDTSFGPCTEMREFATPSLSCVGRSFRFGWPFTLANDTIDELIEAYDGVALHAGEHSVRFGFHAHVRPMRNFFQPFSRGFFLFPGVEDFLNYVNLGPTFVDCSDGSSSFTGTCPPGELVTGPLGAYLQFTPIGATSLAEATARSFTQSELGLFVQDRWQARRGLTIEVGLRWDDFRQPDLIIPPAQTRIAQFLGDPQFPSDGTLPEYHRAFQPRLGIAWDPWNNGKTVFRANGGVFFSRLPGVMMQNAAVNNGNIATTLFTNSLFNVFGAPPPPYPDCITGPALPSGCPVPSGVNAFDPNVILFSREFVYPRTYQWSVWMERELTKDWTFSAGFNYALATHLNRIRAFNLSSPIGTSPDGRDLYLGFLPGPFSGPGGSGTGISPQSSLVTSEARSLYRAATFRVDRKFSRRLSLTMHYTYSRDVDDDSNEADQFTFQFTDPRDLGPERGPSNRDQRHQAAFYNVWQLPWGISWSNTIATHSASPRSLACNFDANGDGTSFTDRVYTDGAGNYSCGPQGAGRILQLSANETVTLVPSLSGGHDTGRNRFRRDDAAFDWNTRIGKEWAWRGEARLFATLDILNVTNNRNLRFPVCDELRDCFVGAILQVPGESRRLRLGLRLAW